MAAFNASPPFTTRSWASRRCVAYQIHAPTFFHQTGALTVLSSSAREFSNTVRLSDIAQNHHPPLDILIGWPAARTA
jgi:hypothetical protein